ncbi:hypothetical protein U3516DRAFT_834373 [Neocallimastix sp. 'constans']
MVLMTLRIKKVYIARAILITFLLVISFLSLKLYSSTLGHSNFSFGKLRSYKYENLTKFFKRLPFGHTTDNVVKQNEVKDYSKLMIGLEEVGDLGTLNKDSYKVIRNQLQEEAQLIVDSEPRFFNKVERGIDRLELEFFMQYARDVEQGKRGGELEPEWEWAKDISIVYTWINGTDEKLLEKKAKFNGGIKKVDQRDRCIDELRYSIRSVCKNLPWHKGKIFIVTPYGQTPYWLDTSNPRIKVIDQYDILPRLDGNGKSVEPTFNSFSIEWFLDRVPGVSEQFIQLNDEYFFRRPVHPSFFFYGGGEGYKNQKVVEKYRQDNPNKNKNKNVNHKHNYKRSTVEDKNVNEDEEKDKNEDENDNYYIHGLKIDKDIRQLVAEELKDSENLNKRDIFLGKRKAKIEEEIEEEVDGNENTKEQGNNEEVDGNENTKEEGNNEDSSEERAMKREKFLKNKIEREKEEEEFNKKSDPGEQQDNEDEGIGIIPKNSKNINVKVLKTEDIEFRPDNSTIIVKREKLKSKRPLVHHYIYPNAAQHYRFTNIYLSDQFLASGFNKARDVARKPFFKTSWMEKFFGAMAMTNACIGEDLGKSTLVNMLEHAPYVWNRDLFELARRRFKKYVNLTLTHKFRHSLDFVPPYANFFYLRHYASQKGFEDEFDKFYNTTYVYDVDVDDKKGSKDQKTRSIMKFGFHIVDFNVRKKILTFGAVFDDPQRNARTFKNIIEHKTLLFFNINDDYNDSEAGKQFHQFMEFLYPEPSIFEKKEFEERLKEL